MSKTRWNYVIAGMILILSLIAYGIDLKYKDIVFDRDIGEHMKRAADANTVELATQEMEIVVKNMKDAGMTSGYTSVVYQTPEDEVKFWFDNMNASLQELKAINPNATQQEKSNVLMKLKETLTDNTEKGIKITAPPGISKFPNNKIYALVGWILLFIAVVGGVLIWQGLPDKQRY